MSKAIKLEQFMSELYDKLTQGDIQSSLQVYDKYTRIFNDLDFIDNILKPTLSKIEDGFANKKISMASEHVAKNVGVTLAKIITDKQNSNNF